MRKRKPRRRRASAANAGSWKPIEGHRSRPRLFPSAVARLPRERPSPPGAAPLADPLADQSAIRRSGAAETRGWRTAWRWESRGFLLRALGRARREARQSLEDLVQHAQGFRTGRHRADVGFSVVHHKHAGLEHALGQAREDGRIRDHPYTFAGARRVLPKTVPAFAVERVAQDHGGHRDFSGRVQLLSGRVHAPVDGGGYGGVLVAARSPPPRGRARWRWS